MKYRAYNNHKIRISEIGLGAWQLGVNSGWRGMTENEAIKLVHEALDKGINFIDTAPNYGHGTGESRLGKALDGKRRDEIVINTKFGHTDSGTTNYNADYIRESLEGSLRRLKTDYVDGLIIHNPPMEYLDGNKVDNYEVLERLKEEGKILEYGASIDSYEELKVLLGTTGSKIIEAFFNILHQDIAQGFDMAAEKNVGIIVKIPLDSGWLTGKYDEDSVFDGVRSRWSREEIKTRASLVNEIKEIIPEDISMTHAALCFCLAYDAVSTIIPGNLNSQQLNSNLASTKFSLSSFTVEKLEEFYREKVKQLKLPW